MWLFIVTTRWVIADVRERSTPMCWLCMGRGAEGEGNGVPVHRLCWTRMLRRMLAPGRLRRPPWRCYLWRAYDGRRTEVLELAAPRLHDREEPDG